MYISATALQRESVNGSYSDPQPYFQLPWVWSWSCFQGWGSRAGVQAWMPGFFGCF